MKRLAEKNPRFGHRRIHVLLRRDGWRINKKRVLRLWQREEMQVPKKRRVRRRWRRDGLPHLSVLGAARQMAWLLRPLGLMERSGISPKGLSGEFRGGHVVQRTVWTEFIVAHTPLFEEDASFSHADKGFHLQKLIA